MADFKKLRVWRYAHALCLNVDKAARRITESDYAPLRRQLIKTGLSITSTIVEGREKTSEAEFVRFLEMSKASTSELEQHLISARDLNLMSQADFHSLTDQTNEVRKMLVGLLKRLRASLEEKKKRKKKERLTGEAGSD